jgi:hypothetical protein
LLSRLTATLTSSWQRTLFSHWRLVDECAENLRGCEWGKKIFSSSSIVSILYESDENSPGASFIPQYFVLLSFIHSICTKILWSCKILVSKFWWLYTFWVPLNAKKFFFSYAVCLLIWMCALLVPEWLDRFSALLIDVSHYLAKPSCSGSCCRFLYSNSSPTILLSILSTWQIHYNRSSSDSGNKFWIPGDLEISFLIICSFWETLMENQERIELKMKFVN